MTLAHRFTLVREEPYDLDGAQRWHARDDRLRRDVTVFLIDEEKADVVSAAVARVSTVRDPRLARIIAAGTDSNGRPPVHYVVFDQPQGSNLGEVLARRNLPPRFAAAIVGSLARALVPLTARRLHHGAVRSPAVTVSTSGAPVLSGLGVDAVLGRPADGEKASERDDATALVLLYVQCVTGEVPAPLSQVDLPADVPEAARTLCATVLRDEPVRLADVVDAFPPDHGALRGFAGAVRMLPLRPDVAQETIHEQLGKPSHALLKDATLTDAARAAARAAAVAHAAPELLPDVTSDRLTAIADLVPPAREVEEDDEPWETDASSQVPPEERDLFDDLEAYDAMVEEQNAGRSRSLWEAIVEWPYRRWPSNAFLAWAYETAHKRAGDPGPLRTKLLLVLLGLVAVFFAWSIALSVLEEPVTTDLDRHNPPEQSYPAYTYGPTASPSADEG